MDAPWWTGDEPDPHPEGRWPETDPVSLCDTCGETIGLYGRVTLQGVGAFCSRTCANAGSAKHEARMQRGR